MKSKSPEWPTREITPCSPENKVDCFRLITKGLELKQGELLADANYILCDNACKDEQKMNGTQLLFYFQNYFKTTFIPWVLARCTIIRL